MKRRVDFILNKKLKFYTKEALKFFNITLIALGLIIAIILIKYKPVYEVTISGQEVGYIKNKEAFQESLKQNIENYSAKNVENVSLEKQPEYVLKLVNKSEDTNENEVLVAIQKDYKINYQYFEIALDGEIIDSVDTQEQAENIVSELKTEKQDLNLEIIKKSTENVEEIQTNTIEVAKQNIVQKIDIKEEEASTIAKVNGIKIAAIPVSGTISSRYGVSSRIRVSTHTGLDIAATTGTPIKVIADGTVTSATYTGSYGNMVKVEHGNGVETWYAHTSKMYVSVGQKVSAGDVIAAVGSTGNSTGPHLHLEIRINGQHVNPQNYLYN